MKNIALFLSSIILSQDKVQAAFGFGSCPSFTTVQNVDRAKFIRTWYEQINDWTIPVQFGTVCGQEIYTDTRSDGNVQV